MLFRIGLIIAIGVGFSMPAEAQIGPPISADFDADFDVDGNDLMIWQRNFGIFGNAFHEQGDADDDGMVTADDYRKWRTEFGISFGSGSRAVSRTSGVSGNPDAGSDVSPLEAVLSLNLRYNDPADPSEGGTWHLMVKTGSIGIVTANAILSGINTTGIVYGTPAGNGYPSVSASQLNADLNAAEPFIVAEGDITRVLYCQDITAPDVVLNVGGGAGTAGNVADDPLGDVAWDDAAVLATGSFGSSRPAFTNQGLNVTAANSFSGSNPPYHFSNELSATEVVRGDALKALNLEAPGLGLLAGDADRNGVVNAADLAILQSNFDTPAGTSLWDMGDFNDANGVDEADLHLLLANLSRAPGDYNADGTVDQVDYSVWRANFGASSGFGIIADGNGNGVVDAADYSIWRDHVSGAGASLAVPEPCALIPTAAMLLVLYLRCCR